MTQLALARRYRPQTFQAVIGQEVTLRALKAGLETKRLHHAYLFTGTRGVGKTTLARLLAKCFNCEQGISANPCGLCEPCQAIQTGSFVDVVEVDAASRTKVEDTRELLDNVQYLPTRARFKIYLIDEVHMLSGHSFNALLKTLEEPPSHVKFLLATTDPQKLPVTVLSRCLQFHLRRLPVPQIVSHLKAILAEEKIPFESEALEIIARAAEGSMRDALSLLDQAITYAAGGDNRGSEIIADDLRRLLGLTEKGRLLNLLSDISMGQAPAALQEVASIAEFAPDFTQVLVEFLTLLHQIAIAQQVPEAVDDSLLEREAILGFAKKLSREEVQLYYQIGLLGQRDLPYAPTPQLGFEMTVLRMLAFQPVQLDLQPSPQPSPPSPAATRHPLPQSGRGEEVQHFLTKREREGEEHWLDIMPALNLSARTKELAYHCSVVEWSENQIHLMLDESRKPILNKVHQQRLEEALSQYFNRGITLKITIGKQNTPMGQGSPVEHPRKQDRTQPRQKPQQIQQLKELDPNVASLIDHFDAKVEKITLPEEVSHEL